MNHAEIYEAVMQLGRENNDLREKVAELEQDIAELEKAKKDGADAARWRYLRTKAMNYDATNEDPTKRVVGFQFPWISLQVGNPESLDREIDAAIAQKEAL